MDKIAKYAIEKTLIDSIKWYGLELVPRTAGAWIALFCCSAVSPSARRDPPTRTRPSIGESPALKLLATSKFRVSAHMKTLARQQLSDA